MLCYALFTYYLALCYLVLYCVFLYCQLYFYQFVSLFSFISQIDEHLPQITGFFSDCLAFQFVFFYLSGALYKVFLSIIRGTLFNAFSFIILTSIIAMLYLFDILFNDWLYFSCLFSYLFYVVYIFILCFIILYSVLFYALFYYSFYVVYIFYVVLFYSFFVVVVIYFVLFSLDLYLVPFFLSPRSP